MTRAIVAKIASERGQTPAKMLIELFDKHGSMSGVARELNVNQSTISIALMRAGLKVKSVAVPRYPSEKPM